MIATVTVPAALVMAANPLLKPGQVAEILEESASGRGSWTPTLGYGILDAAGAVARAQGRPSITLSGVRRGGRVRLSWSASAATRFRLSVAVGGGESRVLLVSTIRTRATYVLLTGRSYVFTVTTLAADGADAAASSFSRHRNPLPFPAESVIGPGSRRTLNICALTPP